MSDVASPLAAPRSSKAQTLRTVRVIDSGVSLPGEESLQVAVEVLSPDPAHLHLSPVALLCLPGGGMNRHFFDLVPADGSTDFSFAAQMCARGFIVVMIDHPGVGDSSSSLDLFCLTPDVIALADARAAESLIAALREGSLFSELPPLPSLRTIGVGHSMGAVITVLQQVAARPHVALALLGFSTAGLPQYVSDEARVAMAKDPLAIRGELARLARAQFGAAPTTKRSSATASADLYAGGKADPRGVLAIKSALATMLPVPALLAMLPGNIARECAMIDVPVFIAVGELDMTGPAHVIPAAFESSRDVTLQVLAQSGHSHFLFAARAQLFERLAGWASVVAH